MAPVGPNLTGVFGRPARSYAGYRYSNAYKAAALEIVWDATGQRSSLDKSRKEDTRHPWAGRLGEVDC